MPLKTMDDSERARLQSNITLLTAHRNATALSLECGEFCRKCHKLSCNIPVVSYYVERRISEVRILCSECGEALSGCSYRAAEEVK